jgi:hypothetical protein
MNTNYQSIRSQINELDNADRIRLLSELFDLLRHSEQAERQQKWAAVAESRLAAYDNGEMPAENWHTLRERLQR